MRRTMAVNAVCKCVSAVLVLTAMAMAMDDSVTVSMGDEIRGVFSVIFLVNADVRSYNGMYLEAKHHLMILKH